MQLSLGNQVATVTLDGGRVLEWSVDGVTLLAGDEPLAPGDPDPHRSGLLAPWPNRLEGGRWSWQGQGLQLPVNHGTSAIHGLVAHAPFAVASSSASSVELLHDLVPTPGYPFALRIHARYALTPEGLVCALEAENTGSVEAPVGLGVHPYVVAPGLVDELSLAVPARSLVTMDAAWREVSRGPVAEAGPIGPVQLDTAFTDLAHANGRATATVTRPDGLVVGLWGGDTCRWMLVYTADTLRPTDRRRSLAVEPMTCPPNALATGDIDVIAPGARLTLDWGLSVR